MPITEETPITGRAFKAWQRQLFRRGPQRLGDVLKAARQMRALTATHKAKR